MNYLRKEMNKVGSQSVPFIKRKIQEQLNSAINNENKKSQSIIICGESGTGKTSLAKEMVSTVISSEEKEKYIIASINLIDDNMTPASFFELLIYTLWSGNIHSADNMLYINQNDSLSKFLKTKRRYRVLAKNLFLAIQSTIALIPSYGAILSEYVGDIKDQINTNVDINKIDILEKYITKLCKKKKMVLLVDNYQFMIPAMKLLLEGCLGTINKNFTFITIYRSKLSDINKPICFADNTTIVEVDNFIEDDVIDIFFRNYDKSEYIKKIAHDCFVKTNGNAKEIELYIRRNDKEIRNHEFRYSNAKTLRETLAELPDIQRYLVLLATLFPSGLKTEYICHFVEKIFINANQDIEYELTKLMTLGYVVVNSVNNNLLKPAHDKIGLNVDKIESDEDFIEFYNSIEKTLEELIISRVDNDDYVYFLHCLIGVCSIHDLMRNINRLIELIGIKYNNCSYYYIAELIRDIESPYEIIACLPRYSITQILDSCQKASEFSLGLSIYEQWKNNKNSNDSSLEIYAIKFLTQMYNFDQALELIDRLNISNEIVLYKLIILQHKALDDKAKSIVDNMILNCTDKDKWYYLVLRNSAHYYNYEQAYANLNESLSFFNSNGTIFEQATIHNNLSVIQIWNGGKTFKEAEINVKQAINKHLIIQSNEIFEAYCNYSVLKYLQGDFRDAVNYIEMALDEVPSRLELDVIILSVNKLLYELALTEIDTNTALSSLQTINNKPVITKDPWVKFQVEYNLLNLEKLIKGESQIVCNDYFTSKNKALTGFEVFTSLEINNSKMPISLSLSPNWRY